MRKLIKFTTLTLLTLVLGVIIMTPTTLSSQIGGELPGIILGKGLYGPRCGCPVPAWMAGCSCVRL